MLFYEWPSCFWLNWESTLAESHWTRTHLNSSSLTREREVVIVFLSGSRKKVCDTPLWTSGPNNTLTLEQQYFLFETNVVERIFHFSPVYATRAHLSLRVKTAWAVGFNMPLSRIQSCSQPFFYVSCLDELESIAREDSEPSLCVFFISLSLSITWAVSGESGRVLRMQKRPWNESRVSSVIYRCWKS